MKQGAIKKAGLVCLMIFVAALTAYSGGEREARPEEEATTILISTSAEGTWGYSATTAAARVYRDHTNLDVQVFPRPAARSTMYDVSDERIHFAWSTPGMMWEAWNDAGPFSDPDSHVAKPPYQTLTIADSVPFLLVPADSDIQDWGDIVGKRVYPNQAGFGNYYALKAGLEAAGLMDQIEEVQMSAGDAPEAFMTGVIDVCGAYAMGGRLPAWLHEVDARMDVRVIPPLPEHVELMRQNLPDIMPGIFVFDYNVAMAWDQDVGIDNVYVPGFDFGWHAGRHVPEDVVYQFVTHAFELAEQLADTFAGFEMFVDQGLELNSTRTEAIPDVPVHPGMARFMQEQGIWNPDFTIGELNE